jgi:hypothetical protein
VEEKSISFGRGRMRYMMIRGITERRPSRAIGLRNGILCI